VAGSAACSPMAFGTRASSTFFWCETGSERSLCTTPRRRKACILRASSNVCWPRGYLGKLMKRRGGSIFC
jgi:hypothetical protein